MKQTIEISSRATLGAQAYSISVSASDATPKDIAELKTYVDIEAMKGVLALCSKEDIDTTGLKLIQGPVEIKYNTNILDYENSSNLDIFDYE